MKFPQRVLSLLTSVLIITFLCIVVVEFQYASLNRQRRAWNFSEVVQRTVKGNAQECRFAEIILPEKGINTYDLFAKIHKHDGSLVKPPQKPGDDKVTVFLIPHSHTDPGWLMTVDEYYKELTKNILDNLVTKMDQYPEVKFVWGETVFLAIWWNDITSEIKEKFKKLVHSGRVEIINGGWVAPDEAITHYYAIIDQLMEGHQWVEKNLGVKPKVGWSPDPFGYSATMPYLLNRAGMKDMVILRIHDVIKDRLRMGRNLEMHWRQPWDLLSNKTDTFCHIMPYILYNFKHSCGPNPQNCLYFDFRVVPGKNGENRPPSIGKDNIERFSKMLADGFRKKAEVFRHNIIFHAMGDDFRYDTALEWDEQIANYTMLKDYINKQKNWNIDVKYGTLTDYFNAVKDAEKEKEFIGSFPVLHGDFFPYLDFGTSYWTGYYTTRPFYKQLGREVEGNLRTSEILNTLAIGYKSTYGQPYKTESLMKWLAQARQDLAIFQHHDAITGTSKPHTVKDYEKRLWRAKVLTQKVSAIAATYLFSMGKASNFDLDSQSKALYRLYSDDGRTKATPLKLKSTIGITKDGAKMVIFNPVPKIRYELIRMVVNSTDITVVDVNEKPVHSQLSPVWVDQTSVSTDTYQLVFYAQIPSLGMETFTIKPEPNNRYTKKAKLFCNRMTIKECGISPGTFFILQRSLNPNLIEMGNSYHTARFDERGTLISIKDNASKKTLMISPMFMTYSSQGSGAYIFKPSPNHNYLFKEPNTVVYVQGTLVSEMRLAHGILEHNVRVFHTDTSQGAALEVENYLDMTGIRIDTEIFMRFETSLYNQHFIYTDSNGYQMIKRERKDEFKIAGNFFPMATMCYIEDDWMRLSLLAGQPHGVTSLKQGFLDVMLDRKLFRDDYRGLEEGVTDNRRTRTTFLLLLEMQQKKIDLEDVDAVVLPLPSLLSISLIDNLLRPVTNFVIQHPVQLVPTFSPLKIPLPCDIDIVNFKTLVPDNKEKVDVILILHRRSFHCHFQTFDINCPLTAGDVFLNGLFESIKISTMKEVSLSLMYEKRQITPNERIHLDPMEIVTYRIQFV